MQPLKSQKYDYQVSKIQKMLTNVVYRNSSAVNRNEKMGINTVV